MRDVSGTASNSRWARTKLTAPFSWLIARRRDQFMDDFVPGTIRSELLAQPIRQRRAVDHPALVATTDQKDRPLSREILGEIRMIEQVGDQLCSRLSLSRVCKNARASWTLGIRPRRSR